MAQTQRVGDTADELAFAPLRAKRSCSTLLPYVEGAGLTQSLADLVAEERMLAELPAVARGNAAAMLEHESSSLSSDPSRARERAARQRSVARAPA